MPLVVSLRQSKNESRYDIQAASTELLDYYHPPYSEMQLGVRKSNVRAFKLSFEIVV